MAKAKQAHGLYGIRYMLWHISFPYMSERYLFFGPKAGAEAEAGRIKKRTKWPYGVKIREIKI